MWSGLYGDSDNHVVAEDEERKAGERPMSVVEELLPVVDDNGRLPTETDAACVGCRKQDEVRAERILAASDAISIR